jgi:hypothetical protein
MNANSRPYLIEPGTKYFFNQLLKKCKNTKEVYFNNMMNFSLLGLFIIILGGFLFYSYKEKQDIYGKKQKRLQQETFIANKINLISKEQQKKRNEIITNLPEFESHQHIQNKKFL